jgi:hypothetical protein
MEENIESGVGIRVDYNQFGEEIVYKNSRNAYEIIFERGKKWIEGALVLKSGNSLQAKEIPIGAFFHKNKDNV